MSLQKLRDFYELAKPGIIYGNAITLIGGFLLASRGAKSIDFPALAAALIGLSLVIASGCVFNNYIDRDIDAKMERTRGRALVEGRISNAAALIYGSFLGVLGFLALSLWTNLLTVLVGLIGFFIYVVLYSLWSKRRTVYSTIIGSVAGATPPVVGYCAAANRFDIGAVTLFFILALWQMPHFFAIGMYRAEDYASADLPIVPVKETSKNTKINILLYIMLFIPATLALSYFGYVNETYFVAAVILGLAWFAMGLEGFWTKNEKRWARQMFLLSLAVIMVLFITMAAQAFA